MLPGWLPEAVLRLPALVMVLVFLSVIGSIVVWVAPQELLRALGSVELGYAVMLSLATASVSSSLAVLLAIPVAYSMARGLLPGGRLVETVLLLPFAMPPVAVGALLLIFFTNTPLGLLANSVLDVVFTPRGLVVAQFFVVYPVAVRVLKSSFEQVDPRYEAVVRTLGYGRLQTLAYVTIPLARHGLLSALLLSFTRSLGEFGASVTLAGAVKGKTETLPIAIYLALAGGDLGLALALVLISVIVAVVSLLALLVLEERGERG